MSAADDQLKKMKLQADANAVQIQRMQMQMNQNQRRGDYEEEEVQHHQPQYVPPAPQYQPVDQNQLLLDQIVNAATQQATQNIASNISAHSEAEAAVKKRMNRVIEAYPALQQEDSQLVIKARDIYQRITQENPTLDEASKYELSVREAASLLGARPINAPVEDAVDFVLPAGQQYDPARGNPRRGKSRLTANILNNARAMGINIDPKSAEGKNNLKELEDSTARFNADQDEAQFRYR